MKRLFAFISIALLVGLVLGAAPIVASADASGSCGDNITYEYVSETNTVTLTGSGPMTDYTSATKSPFYSLRNELTTVVIGEGITTVGAYAFANQSKLTSITLPSTLVSLNKCAFNQCRAVASCNFPEGLTSVAGSACAYWTGMTSLTLPSTLTAIESGAFSNWQNAVELYIPGSVKYLPINAFAGWTSLTSLTLNEGLEEIAGQAFGSVKITEVTLPTSLQSFGVRAIDGANELAAYYVAEGSEYLRAVDGVLYTADLKTLLSCPPAKAGAVNIAEGCEEVGPSSFYNTYLVTSVNIPNTVTKLCSAAFEQCGMTEITVPASVTEMEASPFSNCANLTTAVINANVSTLSQNFFYYCTALTDVTLGSGITAFESGVFNSCSALESVVLPDTLTEIPENTFYYCTSLNNVVIPESVTVIGSSAFYGCSALTGLEIPEGVTVIGSSAFNSCTNLASLTLPEGLVSLGGSAFSQCRALTHMVLPEGITEIPGMLFAGCTSLVEVEVMGDINNAPGQYCINSGAFNNCTSLERIIFHCACPDKKTVNNYAFNNCAKNAEVHYPAQYPEWAEIKPLDVNNNTFIYVADMTSPVIEMLDVELRERPTSDSWRDMRFIAKLTPMEGCEITGRWVVFTNTYNGATLKLDCPNDYNVLDDGSIIFTAVLINIRPQYQSRVIEAQAFITCTGAFEGTLESNVIAASVDELENK